MYVLISEGHPAYLCQCEIVENYHNGLVKIKVDFAVDSLYFDVPFTSLKPLSTWMAENFQIENSGD